jgi:2-phosphosulfolactate phosphatase
LVEEALALRDAGSGHVCIGEVGGRAPDGFDFGNSPFEISGVDFWGKTVIVMIFVMMTIIMANGE